jgi:cell division protein FtsL
MIKRYFFLYFAVITIPLFLGLTVWQSNRFQNLRNETESLVKSQADWIENNKRLIAVIAVLSSPERIEYIAQNDLNLRKIRPENVLQIKIEEGKEHEL